MKIKHHTKILTPRFCRAARALLDVSQKEIANAASLSQQTVADFERGARVPHQNNLKALRRAFEEQGLAFEELNEEIVAIRAPPTNGASRKPRARKRVTKTTQ